MLRRRLADKRAIDRYLETHAVRFLQLGTGPNPVPGWLNTDVAPETYAEHRHEVLFLDAARPFPLADETIDYIFSEHQVEHISRADAEVMLRQSFRVLRPGGRIRIATPDLAAIVSLLGPRDAAAEHYLDFMIARFIPEGRLGNPGCHIVNHMFYAHGHRFVYDFATLSALLAEVGFVDIVRQEPGTSDDPALRGLERHGLAIGDEDVNHFETMVVEAMRPAS